MVFINMICVRNSPLRWRLLLLLLVSWPTTQDKARFKFRGPCARILGIKYEYLELEWNICCRTKCVVCLDDDCRVQPLHPEGDKGDVHTCIRTIFEKRFRPSQQDRKFFAKNVPCYGVSGVLVGHDKRR